MLTCISEELKDSPFYYQLPDLASRVHSKVPTTIEMQAAIANAGERENRGREGGDDRGWGGEHKREGVKEGENKIEKEGGGGSEKEREREKGRRESERWEREK